LTLTQTAGSYFSTQIAVTREFLVSFDQMMGNRLFSHPWWWLVGVVAMRVCDVIDLPVAAMTAASSAAMARGLPLGRPKELPNRKEKRSG
jgi:hypothetical protein